MSEGSLSAFDIAQVCHEVNKAYCESLGDKSQEKWEDAPEWQRKSALNGVIFHLENPDAGPEASHNEWLDEKRKAGWTYGTIKNEEMKCHPCMLPFKNLPPSQQAKDFIFRQVVHSLRKFI